MRLRLMRHKIEHLSNNPTYLIRKSTPFGVDFLYLCKRIKQYNLIIQVRISQNKNKPKK